MEEGLIPADTAITMPAQKTERATVPESMKQNAGIYDAGVLELMNVEFTRDSLILTPLMVKNERPQEYIYNTDGEFVSTNGDYISINPLREGTRGISRLSFPGNGYIVTQTYENLLGLSVTAYALPIAEKLSANEVSGSAVNAWSARNDKEYLLVSEKYTSEFYLSYPIAKTLTDDRIGSYVCNGIYNGSGFTFPATRIADENTTHGFQRIPTFAGRDTVNIHVTARAGVEYLSISECRFIDAATAKTFSELGETIIVGSEPTWVDIDSDAGGKIVSVTTPANGSWFVYDDKMNCITTSLEKHLRSTIILPENGRLAFVGEPGATFVVR
jgi:hypothetical protein